MTYDQVVAFYLFYNKQNAHHYVSFITYQDGHCSDEISTTPTTQYLEASRYVSRLQTAKLVYRTMTYPIGNISCAENRSYSVRGYFIPAIGPGYQFITHIPLRQHWRFEAKVISMFN